MALRQLIYFLFYKTCANNLQMRIKNSREVKFKILSMQN